jgi:hypothetical protein
LVNDPTERTTDNRESVSQARRAVSGTRARLEGVADRLAEFARRLPGGRGPDSPEPDGGASDLREGSVPGGGGGS